MIIQFFVPCESVKQAKSLAKTLHGPGRIGHGFIVPGKKIRMSCTVQAQFMYHNDEPGVHVTIPTSSRIISVSH